MKKLLSIFLAMTMAVSAFACTFAVSADTGITFDDSDLSMVTAVGDVTFEIENSQLKVFWKNLWDSNLDATNYARIAVDATGLSSLTFDAYVAAGTGWDGATNKGAHIGVEIDGVVYWDTTYDSGHIQSKSVENFEIVSKKMFAIANDGTFFKNDNVEEGVKRVAAEDVPNIDAICIRPATNMMAQFTYVDNISAPAPTSAPEPSEVQFGAQIALQDTIELSFVPELDSTEGITAAFTVDGETVEEDVVAVDGKYTYAGINPGDMGKQVTAVLYQDGEEIATATTSVADYCKKLIADESQTTEVKDLAYSVLYYGAAAQTYLGDTDTLVTDGVEYELSKDLFASMYYSDSSFKHDDYDDAEITSAWLNLSNSIAIKFKVETAMGVDDIYLLVEDSAWNDVARITGEQKEGYIEFTFDELNASQGREAFNFTVHDVTDDSQLSGLVGYSVEYYAARVYDSVETNMQNLIEAVMNYAFYAEMYVGSID